jgi:hypothetical protein
MAYISQRRSSRVRFVRPVPLRPWAEGWRAPPVALCARLALKNGPPPARRPKVGSTLLKFLKRPQQSKTGSWSGSPRSSLGAPDYWRAIGVGLWRSSPRARPPNSGHCRARRRSHNLPFQCSVPNARTDRIGRVALDAGSSCAIFTFFHASSIAAACPRERRNSDCLSQPYQMRSPTSKASVAYAFSIAVQVESNQQPMHRPFSSADTLHLTNCIR